ncbi:MAG: anti-sigma-D factor RsdA, partial [Mycobacterium sp.]
MPDFDRTPGGEPSLEDIRRSDSFIEALSSGAGGAPVAPADQADAALAALLGTWRDESRWPPDAGLISEPQAIAALDAGLAEKRTGVNRDKWVPTTSPAKRNRRGLSVVGAAAAAMLCIGGFGAVVSGAGPGDSLYGLRTMLFGAPKQVRDDQVALAARTEMQQVQELISRGDWQQAEEKLVAVSNQVSSIGDVEQKQQLLD